MGKKTKATDDFRETVALAIARTMPGWNEDTSEPNMEPGPMRDAAEAHWKRVNKSCLEQGRTYADAAISVGLRPSS